MADSPCRHTFAQKSPLLSPSFFSMPKSRHFMSPRPNNGIWGHIMLILPDLALICYKLQHFWHQRQKYWWKSWNLEKISILPIFFKKTNCQVIQNFALKKIRWTFLWLIFSKVLALNFYFHEKWPKKSLLFNKIPKTPKIAKKSPVANQNFCRHGNAKNRQSGAMSPILATL